MTKDGRPVAVLAPRDAMSRSAIGFARVEIKGDLNLPSLEWTFDAENLKRSKKRGR